MSSSPSRTSLLLQTLRSGRELSVRDELELVVRLAVPAALAQVSYILMQYIDASMVGHLGAADSAAVGLVSTTLWLFYGIGGASIMGFSVQTAHRIGAEDFDAARSIVRQAFTTVMTFSAVLAAAGFLISPHLPVWLGGDPSIAGNASDYFLMMALFLPATYFGWLAGALLRATGDMKTPSYLGILMCILNCFFNFLLIFPTSTYTFLGISLTVPGADLGIIGAAVGTGIAETIVGAIMLWMLVVRSPFLSLVGRSGSFIPQATVLRRAFSIASPVAAERILMCGAQILSTAIVAPLGIVSIAAHTLGITAESLCYMPGYGIGDAASTLVGQSVGAKRLDLAKRIAYKCVGAGMVVMSVMGVVLYFAAPVLMGIMTDVPEVIELGRTHVRCGHCFLQRLHRHRRHAHSCRHEFVEHVGRAPHARLVPRSRLRPRRRLERDVRRAHRPRRHLPHAPEERRVAQETQAKQLIPRPELRDGAHCVVCLPSPAGPDCPGSKRQEN